MFRVPRTADPSGASVVLHASELRRIQEASTVLSPQQRREKEDERKREREVKQVGCRDFTVPAPLVVSCMCGVEVQVVQCDPPYIPLYTPPQDAASRRKKEMEEWELKRKTHEKPSDLEQVGVCVLHWVGAGGHAHTPVASSKAVHQEPATAIIHPSICCRRRVRVARLSPRRHRV